MSSGRQRAPVSTLPAVKGGSKADGPSAAPLSRIRACHRACMSEPMTKRVRAYLTKTLPTVSAAPESALDLRSCERKWVMRGVVDGKECEGVDAQG